jgi:sec-independent protein translocase protein TatC
MTPVGAFAARLKVAFLLGAVFSAPIWFFHAWRFLGVALTVGERKAISLAFPASTLLFAAGAAFAWFGVAPAGLKFLMGFGGGYLKPMISVESALSFALWLSLGLGVLFQLPVILSALASWGLVTSHDLRRHRRQAVLVILILAAVLTPGPDVASQLLLAVPTYILFEISILASALFESKNP